MKGKEIPKRERWWQRFLAAIWPELTLIAATAGLAITVWAFSLLFDESSQERRASEACAPYQVIRRFSDRGHELAVCRLPQGLVVREVPRD